MRIVAKTTPMRQWEVARELRARVKATLDAAGVIPVNPDAIVISATAGAAAPVGAPEPVPAAAAPEPVPAAEADSPALPADPPALPADETAGDAP
jgi:small conductance mechanosensitive channel